MLKEWICGKKLKGFWKEEFGEGKSKLQNSFCNNCKYYKNKNCQHIENIGFKRKWEWSFKLWKWGFPWQFLLWFHYVL